MSTFRWTLLAVSLSVVLGLTASNAAEPEAPEPPGKKVFAASKCTMCHNISAAGIGKAGEKKMGSDLSSVGSERKADWIAAFLLKKVDVGGKKHMKQFTGAKAELDTLSTWLASLKAGASDTTKAAAPESNPPAQEAGPAEGGAH